MPRHNYRKYSINPTPSYELTSICKSDVDQNNMLTKECLDDLNINLNSIKMPNKYSN